jgi:hypothetical protein
MASAVALTPGGRLLLVLVLVLVLVLILELEPIHAHELQLNCTFTLPPAVIHDLHRYTYAQN